MPNRNYRRGRNYEYRVARLLEAVGYTCSRTAGSHGMYDVIAIKGDTVRLIQVKAGKSPFSEQDREAFLLMAAPTCVQKELWRFPGGRKPPVIDVLTK